MQEKPTNEVKKDMLIGEAYGRIRELLSKYEKAREEMSYVSRLLHSWIAIYEDESGKEFPEEMLQQAGIGMARPVRPAPAPVVIPRLPSIPEAVFEVVRKADEPLHLNAIVEKVFSKGYNPDVKKPKERVRIALIRGVKRGIYERTDPNTFKVNPPVRNKQYQEL